MSNFICCSNLYSRINSVYFSLTPDLVINTFLMLEIDSFLLYILYIYKTFFFFIGSCTKNHSSSVYFVVDLNSLSHSCASVDYPAFLLFTSSITQNLDNISFVVCSSLGIRVLRQPIFIVCILLPRAGANKM